MESMDNTWRGFEKQGQDDNGWMYSVTGSPSTQAAFYPTSPTQSAFPQSTIMAKRRSQLTTGLAPMAPTLSMVPPLAKNFASMKPELYDHQSSIQMPTLSDTFRLNEQMNMGLDRAAGSTMDWSYGMDDSFGDLGSQEQSVKGC